MTLSFSISIFNANKVSKDCSEKKEKTHKKVNKLLLVSFVKYRI